MRYVVWKDGEIYYQNEDMDECHNWLFKYIHKNAPYSYNHAMKHEGWEVLPIGVAKEKTREIQKGKEEDAYLHEHRVIDDFEEPEDMSWPQRRNMQNQILDMYNRGEIDKVRMNDLMKEFDILAKNWYSFYKTADRNGINIFNKK